MLFNRFSDCSCGLAEKNSGLGTCNNIFAKLTEGALCESVEVTDPAVLELNGPVRGELWVSVETGYPVLVQVEMTGGEDGQQRQVVTVDQLQWDAEYEESEFEIEIPPDYEKME